MAARVVQWARDRADGKPVPYIQNAFPNLNADQREQIMTGTHPKCWDELFPPEEDE